MPGSNWIRAAILLAALAMVGLSALTGDTIDEQGLRWLGGVIGGVVVFLLGFERIGWRLPGLRRLTELGGARVIHGTWRGTLRYERDADGQSGGQPIFLAVRQTYSTVAVRGYFPTTGSESEGLIAALSREDHRHVLRYVYRTQAPAPERDRNRSTEGTVELRVIGRPVEEVSGSYYAERNGARGTIVFDGYCRQVAGSAEHARRLPYRDLPAARSVSAT